MRIGASFNLLALPQRPAATTGPVPPGNDKDASGSRTGIPSATAIDPSVDGAKTRTSQQTDSSRFYSTHRELPLRAQEAMQAYQITAGFQFGNTGSELAGVDLYA